MDYKIGKTARVVVARFNDGDDVLGGLRMIAKDNNIKSAVLWLLGGMKKGRFVVGPQKDEMPPVPVWRELAESHEVLGVGTIFWHGDEPRVHFHGVYAKNDNVKAGCLREGTETFLVLEAVIIEIEGINAVRETDPVSGMALLKLL